MLSDDDVWRQEVILFTFPYFCLRIICYSVSFTLSLLQNRMVFQGSVYGLRLLLCILHILSRKEVGTDLLAVHRYVYSECEIAEKPSKWKTFKKSSHRTVFIRNCCMKTAVYKMDRIGSHYLKFQFIDIGWKIERTWATVSAVVVLGNGITGDLGFSTHSLCFVVFPKCLH